jgi:hypothetical protein
MCFIYIIFRWAMSISSMATTLNPCSTTSWLRSWAWSLPSPMLRGWWSVASVGPVPKQRRWPSACTSDQHSRATWPACWHWQMLSSMAGYIPLLMFDTLHWFHQNRFAVESSLHAPVCSQESSLHALVCSQESSLHAPVCSQESSLHALVCSQVSSLHAPVGSQESSLHAPVGSQESSLRAPPDCPEWCWPSGDLICGKPQARLLEFLRLP